MMEHAYGTALWKMIEKGLSPKKAVHALRENLVAQGRENLFPKIAHAFGRIAARDRERNGVVLSIAHAKDKRSAKKEAKKLLFEMDVEGGDVMTRVDESLIGGWRLEGREQLLDRSFKKSLLSIYNRVTSA